MLYSIDIIKDESVVSNWKSAIEKQCRLTGFKEAKLQKVYKKININGYAYVSLVAWDSVENYHNAIQEIKNTQEQHSTLFNTPYFIINSADNQKEIDKGVDDKTKLIVTNPYRISPIDAEKNAEMWNTSKEHMQNQDGFIRARLYQCSDAKGEYYFVSQAEWRTEEMFMKQFEGKDFKQIIKPFEKIFSICFLRELNRIF